MLNSETARIGILKRKLIVEDATSFSTPAELVNLIEVQLQVSSKLFKLILEFGRRYINDSYHITLYINLARVIRAE